MTAIHAAGILMLCSGFLFCTSLQAGEMKMPGTPPSPNDSTTRHAIAAEMRQLLERDFALWYPLCLDTTDGGYFSDISQKWQIEGPQNKFIVTQARHIWSASKGAEFYDCNEKFLPFAAHGFHFLRNVMWDGEHGGFFDLVTCGGKPVTQHGEIFKTAYGNAFAVYGLAAYAKRSGDVAAMRLAQEGFRWLESHSFDPTFGGYFQFLRRDGTPLTEGYRGTPPKDQNSTIHLLEAYTELYGVWQNDTLRQRLASLLRLVRDTITTPDGYMRLFFRKEWSPVSYQEADANTRQAHYEVDHVSFGHDIETAYLLLEAAEALGMKNDPVTMIVARKMVDRGFRTGWDPERGGIFDGGFIDPKTGGITIVRPSKEWWAQFETMNSLLLMSHLYPGEAKEYYGKFTAQWNYCKKYLLDEVYGGWYWGGIDAVPENREGPKATIWKADYHTARALMNCIRALENGASR